MDARQRRPSTIAEQTVAKVSPLPASSASSPSKILPFHLQALPDAWCGSILESEMQGVGLGLARILFLSSIPSSSPIKGPVLVLPTGRI